MTATSRRSLPSRSNRFRGQPDGSRRGDGGFVTVQYVAASAFALVLFVLAANVLVDLYVRAAVREALDEGARAAVPAAAQSTTCEQRATDAIAALARGRLARRVRVTCDVGSVWVRADARVSLRGFVPWLMPTWTFTVHAVAQREPT